MVRNLLILFSAFLFCACLNAQNKTEVIITQFSGDKIFKEKVERNVSSFLTALNCAYFNRVKPKFDESIFTENAHEVIKTLWISSPFMCNETRLLSYLVEQTDDRWQIREIPITIKKVSNNEKAEEGVIIISASGLIDDFHFGIESGNYNSLFDNGIDLTEFRRRQIILDFVENFRTAYNRKDINFLESIFSENALIIVGRVIEKQPLYKDAIRIDLGNKGVEYIQLNKSQYIKNLKERFKENKFINVGFDSIEIKKSAQKDFFYGVALKQKWRSSRYGDDGYVFLLISFKDENKPLIYVRTWEYAKLINRKQAISLNDFNIN